MTKQMLIVKYTLFAIIATVVNLAVQRVVLHFGDSATIFTIALGAGTIAGLLVKYMLDKRWIFYDLDSGIKNHSKKFLLYTSMGVVTTIIFWGMETIFWLIWHTDVMREVGAIIGLAIGYVAKYQLDRRFVFSDNQLKAET